MPTEAKPIDLGAIVTDGRLQIARAVAIEQYARLESALSRLLSVLLGTSFTKASIVFFNLLNTRARNTVFESLITETHGTAYDTYWNGRPGSPGVPRASGLLALIRQLDDERNRLVHWHTVRNVAQNPDGSQSVTEQLMKPDFWLREPQATQTAVHVADLEAFAQKADFVARSVTMFFMVTGLNAMPEEAKKVWYQIFNEPVIYPPPDTHPLSQH